MPLTESDLRSLLRERSEHVPAITDLGGRAEQRGRAMRRRRSTAAVAVVAIAAVATVPQFADRSASPPGAPVACPPPATPLDRSLTHPTGSGIAEEIHHFRSLAEMTAASDLVVRACVRDIKRGHYEYDQGPGARLAPVLQARVITLAVQEVLADKTGSKPRTVEVYDGHWTRGTGIQFADHPWNQVGDAGFYFLTRTSTGIYALVSSQGKVPVRDGGLVPPKGSPITTTSPAELAEQIRGAAKKPD